MLNQQLGIKNPTQNNGLVDSMAILLMIVGLLIIKQEDKQEILEAPKMMVANKQLLKVQLQATMANVTFSATKYVGDGCSDWCD